MEGTLNLPYELPGPLRTERLTLRHMTAADVADVFAYRSLPEVARYVPQEPASREEVEEAVERYAAARRLEAERDFWQLAMEHEGRVVGDLYFVIKSLRHQGAEIGWTLHPDWQGRGLAAEGARALLRVAFETLRLHRVAAELDPCNRASAALCERLGMRREAYYVEDYWMKGAWCDTAMYGILAREFTPATG